MDSSRRPDRTGAWGEGAGPAALRAGGRVGRYELLAPVGSGGMAQVWAARLVAYGGISKIVAIKTVLPHLAHDGDLQQMLLDEARIVAQLHHPNACTLLDAGEEHGVVFVALEWVDGDSLLHVLRAGRAARGASLGPLLAARVIADACAGLHAAHELVDGEGRSLGVVHRDVSPHNILLSIDGHVKVTDFGVAKSHGQWHQTTRSGEIRGKIAYMAPEQINAAPLDRRSDLFGMGCVLYEASTGRPPFRGDNDAALIRAVLDGRYEAPGHLVPGYPAGLAAIVERALAPHPDARFATAAQMGAVLEGWLAQHGAPVTSSGVGALVRERLGGALAVRRREIQGSGEGDSRGPSTRPVRIPGRTSMVLAPPAPPPAIPGAIAGPTDSASRTSNPAPHSARERRRANLRLALAIASGLLAAGAIIGTRLAGTTARPAESAASAPVTGIVVRTSDRPVPPTTLPSLTIARRPSATDVVESAAAWAELSTPAWPPVARAPSGAAPPRDVLAPASGRPAGSPDSSAARTAIPALPQPPARRGELPANPY